MNSKILIILGLTILVILIIKYRKKLNIGEKINYFLSVYIFLVSMIIIFNQESENKSEYKLLNKPYIEPTIIYKNDSIVLFKLLNNGNLPGDSIVFYFTYESGIRTYFEPFSILPHGKIERQFNIKSLMGNTNLSIYYKGNIKEKYMSFSSLFKFNIEPEKNREFNYYSSNHTEEPVNIKKDIFKILNSFTESDIGTFNFWFNINKEINDITEIINTESIKILYFPKERKLIFQKEFDNNYCLFIDYKVQSEFYGYKNFCFVWEDKKVSKNAILYVNGEKEIEVNKMENNSVK